MGDSTHTPGSRKTSEVTHVIASEKVSKKCLVASTPQSLSQKSARQIALFCNGKLGKGTASHAMLFLLKVAALETVRRFSRAKCPFLWSGLQGLQVLCYPPFKWIQRWSPFKGFVRGMQILSRPLLIISIATAFSDQSQCNNVTSDDIEDSEDLNDSLQFSELHSELPSLQLQSTLDSRILDEAPQSLLPKSWLLQLYAELEKVGICLPERMNEDELQRFYAAANGDFSCLLSSVKKTIRWRETYNILSGEELEMWSSMVFWHGFDVKRRPCLIVRLGHACTTLPSHDRPRFAQAVVSQVEYGVLHLVDSENPQITVLLDCEGLSPLRFPMQMMRSCSTLLQDHFPNRLGCLFVILLPPVVRVIAQTFVQVLKPVTRQKLKIEGEVYNKVLTDYLQRLPAYLGGTCRCMRCSNLSISNREQPQNSEEIDNIDTDAYIYSSEELSSPHPNPPTDVLMDDNCDHVLRTAMVGILILWILIVFIAGLYDPESRPVLPL